ncbi:hypothetical protein G159_02065 [Planococcus glaciei CHR43]|nr:hypothetical protein G159_02065 [Planococcus glaciei CHR43]
MTDDNVDKIVETYRSRETIEQYSYAANLEELKENDYNLNIQRYVDTFIEEEPVDLKAVQVRLKEIDQEIAEIDQELEEYFKELEVIGNERTSVEI